MHACPITHHIIMYGVYHNLNGDTPTYPPLPAVDILPDTRHHINAAVKWVFRVMLQ